MEIESFELVVVLAKCVESVKMIKTY